MPPPVRVEFYVAYAFGPPEIISFAAFYPEGGLGWRDRHTRTGTVLVGCVKVQNWRENLRPPEPGGISPLGHPAPQGGSGPRGKGHALFSELELAPLGFISRLAIAIVFRQRFY